MGFEQNFPKWEDEAVNSYWLIESPYIIPALSVFYLVFVTRLGPFLMKNRQPFDLKYPMMLYNIFQVIFNIWFLVVFFGEPGMFNYILKEGCYPNQPGRSKRLRLFAFKISWVWLMSKISDLIDTVFFVLRKKQSHISFLHLYHHTHMVLSVWFYMKYLRGEQAIMIGVVNSFVHICMYGYYFLAALGPSVQRYLWWKKYITWIQLFQFFILMLYFVTSMIACPLPALQAFYNLYATMQGIVFTSLFANFYFQSYTKPARKSSTATPAQENGARYPSHS